MYLLYSLLLTVGFLALLPWFAIDALRTRKYITGLRQRLGKLPAIAADDRPLIWLHCVSVGETEAARPLVRALLARFPSYRLVISTTTVTGQRIARDAFGRDAAAVFYFPIDWAWTVRRVLRTLQPAAVLIMETELWPHLLRECRARAIPVALINGRISITSFGRYKMIRPFIRGVLDNLSIALMQSEQDAARIRELGIPTERVLMPGNLKFDSAEGAIDESATASLRERFGFDGSYASDSCRQHACSGRTRSHRSLQTDQEFSAGLPGTPADRSPASGAIWRSGFAAAGFRLDLVTQVCRGARRG